MTVGLAVTDAPVVALSPVAGDQLYVVAPAAVNVIEDPLQMVGELTVTVGVGVTVTVITTGALVQVPVPTTLYVVVTVGLATTELPVVELNPVPGVQL